MTEKQQLNQPEEQTKTNNSHQPEERDCENNNSQLPNNKWQAMYLLLQTVLFNWNPSQILLLISLIFAALIFGWKYEFIPPIDLLDQEKSELVEKEQETVICKLRDYGEFKNGMNPYDVSLILDSVGREYKLEGNISFQKWDKDGAVITAEFVDGKLTKIEVTKC